MFETIISRRCDKAMKRSKQRGYLPRNYKQHWYCTGDCPGCFCCIEKDQDGNERHVPYWRRHEAKRI